MRKSFWIVFYLIFFIAVSNYAQVPEDSYIRGYVYIQKGMFNEGIAEYERVLTLNPDKEMETRVRYNLGIIYYKLNFKEKALEQFQKALVFNPNLFLVRQNIARTYYDLGKYNEAVEEYKKALQIDSDFPDVYLIYYNLGSAYNQLSKFNEALECLNKSLTLKPEYPGALVQIAITYINMKQFDNAERTLNMLESLGHPQPNLFIKLQEAKKAKN